MAVVGKHIVATALCVRGPQAHAGAALTMEPNESSCVVRSSLELQRSPLAAVTKVVRVVL